MEVINSLFYEENADQNNRFSRIDVDFDLDSDYEITINGTDQNGDFVSPRFIGIDNYTNDADVAITIDDIGSTVASFTKVIWEVNPLVQTLRLSADGGEITVWISEKKLPIGEGINEHGQSVVASNVIRTNTRASLMAIANPKQDMAVLMTEGKRWGLFVFQAIDLSADVTADPNQGINIAPSGDPTGKSGAWVRQFDNTWVRPGWFGAIGDGVNIDYNAWLSLKNYIASKARAHTTDGYNAGVLGVMMEFAIYNFDTNILDWDYAPRMLGIGSGGAGGPATKFKSNKTTIFRIQSDDTTGQNGTQASTLHRGNEIVIEGCTFDLGYNGGAEDATVAAIWCRGEPTIRDIQVYNSPGYGVKIIADSAQPTIKGNANLSTVHKAFFQNCMIGLEEVGGDTNACNFTEISGIDNRQYTWHSKSFLGNTAASELHSAGAARTAFNDGVTVPCSYCANGNGQLFFVVPGQEAFCAANAPPATATSNTGWHYWQPGNAVPALGVILWSAGKVWRGGGQYFIEGPLNATVLTNAYAEIDAPSFFDQAAGLLGETSIRQVAYKWTGNAIVGNGSDVPGIDFYAHRTKIYSDTEFAGITNFLNGTQNFGPQAGTNDLTFNMFSTSSETGFWQWLNGAVKGYLRNIAGRLYINAVLGLNFRVNGTDSMRIDQLGGLTTGEVAAASITAPNPAEQVLFIDSADHKLKRKDSAGTVVIIN